MKVKNETRYDGRDIRGLFCACARWCKADISKLTVKVVYYAPRENLVTARGRTLKIIRPERLALGAVDQLGGIAGGGAAVPRQVFLDLCSLVEWYVWDGGKRAFSGWHKKVPGWAEGRRVRIKPLLQKPEKLTGVSYQEAEIAKAEIRIAAWEKKRHRAEGAAKKLKREIRERRGRIKRIQKDSQR